MRSRQPTYNRGFHCLGGTCPDTCCRDWSIVPDEAFLTACENAPEPLRTAVLAALTRDDDGDVCFALREDGFCALLTGDGLCPIQRDWGEEHLCAHCAAYPRFTEEYGPLSETTLAISCPEAARLLMETERFTTEEQENGGEEELFDGIDPALFSALEHSRAEVLDILREDSRPIWRRLADVAAYADDLQDCIDFGAYGSMEECTPEPVEGEGAGRRMLTARLMELCAGLEPLRPDWSTLLERRAAQLRGMKADYWQRCAAFGRAYPQWERHLTNLACYLVFRHWHKTVNDDALYGRGALVGAACLLLYHLCLLAWDENGALFPMEEAALWSAFSREIEHLDENLTDLIETLFDNESWPIISALCENGGDGARVP